MKDAAADSMLDRWVLGRYRILRKLAKGGMGAVYLARIEGAEGFARPVVVKRVLPALMGDPEIAQLFVREARILSNLRHPNIVDVLDFGSEGDGGYVTVFEYVNGYSLAAWLTFVKHSNKLVPIDFALYLTGRILEALHYAHTLRRADGTAMQIIHRDVSPSNLLLSDQGAVKLLDFGIAQMSGERSDGRSTKPRIRGQLPYLAPELFRGEPATVRSDVFAAGVVLYELLTGINPFAGREISDIYQKVANTIPASVHAVRDDAPEDVDNVLAYALHKDPKLRYRTAAEFARALRALRQLPEEAVAQALTEQLRSDFAGPLPQALGLEPLEVREAAWREGRAPGAVAPAPAASEPETVISEPTEEFPVDEVVTVAAELSPELVRETAADSAPEPAPRQPRAQRTVWIASLAALCGIAATALIGLAVGSPEQPVVVIERPARARTSAKAAPPAGVGAVAAQTAPASRAVEAAAASAPATAPAAAPSDGDTRDKDDPPPPNPRALTRAFERRHERVEDCFTQHAAGLQGQPEFEVYFRVGAEGRVLDAQLEPAALAGTSLGRCLLQVARTTRFNPQRNDVSFHIPITARKAAK